MEIDSKLKDLLTICIPTYNRKDYLKCTLKQLLDSPFSDCNIYVMNNASTDGTELLAISYAKHPNIHFITNRYNIGGNANILRGVEYADTPYVWIIGDDDEYDFSDVEDIIAILKEGDIDLIHVGAHTEKPWICGGQFLTPRQALEKGYSYFKYSSFVGCNIFKREALIKFMIDGYNNIFNSYPHMPMLLSYFENDKIFYIAKNQMAKAVVGNQGYNFDNLIQWWCGTCNLLKSNEDKRLAFADQFKGKKIKMFHKWKYDKKHISNKSVKMAMEILKTKDRIIIKSTYPFYWLFIKFRTIIRQLFKKRK